MDRLRGMWEFASVLYLLGELLPLSLALPEVGRELLKHLSTQPGGVSFGQFGPSGPSLEFFSEKYLKGTQNGENVFCWVFFSGTDPCPPPPQIDQGKTNFFWSQDGQF